MTKTKEDFNREKTKMSGIKAAISRSCNSLEKLCKKLEEMLNRTAEVPKATARKTAENINKIRGVIDTLLEDISAQGNVLMQVAAGLKVEETTEKDLETMVAKRH